MTLPAPRVSIVTPFLNAERYLQAAIESVCAQTYQDWELLLVDDGSSDRGPEIAGRFAETDSRIRLLPPDPNRRGAAAARNRGIAVAQGALIACLDADDLFLPTKLANDLSVFDADPDVAWVYGASRWFYQDGSGRDWTEGPGVVRNRTLDGSKVLIRTLLRERGDVPCPCAVLMRKDVVEAVGGFEERFALYEDQALWAKLLLHGRVRVTPGCHALYRQHSGSTSVSAVERGEYHPTLPHRARRAFLEWLRDYCVDHGSSPDVRQAVDRSLAECDGGRLLGLQRRLRRLSRRIPFLP